MSEPTSVYRYYDAHKVLIYVGITKRGVLRQREHNEHAEWWQFVGSQEVDHYDTREIASAQESFLIRQHRPPFNKSQNPDHERLRDAYLTLFGPRTFAAPSVTGPMPAPPFPCGHCGSCRTGDGSPCELDPSSTSYEESLTCTVCGDPVCTHAIGESVGSQDGWTRAVDFYGFTEVHDCYAKYLDVISSDMVLRWAVDNLRPKEPGVLITGPTDPVHNAQEVDAEIDRAGLKSLVDACDPWANVGCYA